MDYTNSKDEKDNRPKVRFYLVAGISLIVSLAGVILNIYQWVRGTRDWQILVNLMVGFVGVCLSIFVMGLVKRNRISLAGLLLIGYSVFFGLVATGLFVGIGLSMQVIIILAGFILTYEMVGDRYRRPAVVISVLAGFIAFFMDLLPPFWRIPAATPTINFTIIVILFVFYGIYILARLPSYKVRTRLLLFFIGINLLAVFALTIGSVFQTRRISINNTSQKLLISARGLTSEINSFLRYQQEQLKTKASTIYLQTYLSLSLEGKVDPKNVSELDELLGSWQAQDPDHIISIALLDENGVNTYDTNDNNTGRNESGFDFFKVPKESGVDFISPVNFLNRDTKVITFSSPIQKLNSEFLGVLRIHLNPVILQQVVENYNGSAGEESFGVLIDDSGIILAHGTEPDLNHFLISGISDDEISRLQQNSRLGAIVKFLDLPKLRSQLTGRPATSKEIELISSNAESIGFAAQNLVEKSSWMVLFYQPEETAMKPVETLTNRVVILTEIIIIIVIVVGSFVTRLFTTPLQHLLDAAQSFSNGNLFSQVDLSSQDEFSMLAQTFNQMVNQLRTSLEELEYRIRERTVGIEMAAEVGRRISSVLNTSTLSDEIVNQLQNAFNYYHVQIYLYESNNNLLRLVSGSGQAGAEMVASGHCIPLGSGLVGRAGQSKTRILVKDASADPDWLPNPLLPETKSETAIPIILGKELLGVLDVQQNSDNGLSAQDTDLLQLIASQIATSIRNARLMEESQKRLARESTLDRILDQIHQSTQSKRTMQVAIREIGRLTNAKITHIRRYTSNLTNDA